MDNDVMKGIKFDLGRINGINSDLFKRKGLVITMSRSCVISFPGRGLDGCVLRLSALTLPSANFVKLPRVLPDLPDFNLTQKTPPKTRKDKGLLCSPRPSSCRRHVRTSA